jgi:hypothetical protein
MSKSSTHAMGIVLGHEYGHHVLSHCVRHSPDTPLYSDIINSYGGNIENQAREIQADGYAVYLVIHALLLGARRNTVAEGIPSITDEGHLCLFIIAAATFFFIREPGRTRYGENRRTYASTSGIATQRIHAPRGTLLERKQTRTTYHPNTRAFSGVAPECQGSREGHGPAWPEQDQFGQSPAGEAYIKKLYAAYDVLQERHTQGSGSEEPRP